MIDVIIRKFKECTLTKEEWSHEAHLIVGAWYVYHYSLEDAICRLRSGIILLNQTHGTENSGQSGYHETMTVFWAEIIFAFNQRKKYHSADDLAADFLSTPLRQKHLPFVFYHKEEILSEKYRAMYHPPGLQQAVTPEIIEDLLAFRINIPV